MSEITADYDRWLDIVREAITIRNDIMQAGEMATKTRVENVLMERHGMDRYDAHNIMNHIEHRNYRTAAQVIP